MFNLGFGELAVIFIVLIIAVGPDRLPTMMKGIGKTIRTVRQASRDIRATVGIDELLREDVMAPLPRRQPPKAALPRSADIPAPEAAPPPAAAPGQAPAGTVPAESPPAPGTIDAASAAQTEAGIPGTPSAQPASPAPPAAVAPTDPSAPQPPAPATPRDPGPPKE